MSLLKSSITQMETVKSDDNAGISMIHLKNPNSGSSIDPSRLWNSKSGAAIRDAVDTLHDHQVQRKQ